VAVSAGTYERLALEDTDHHWELHDGDLVEKPPMAFAHNDLMFELAHELRLQLPGDQFRVRANAGRLRRSARTYFIPDVFIIPNELTAPFQAALSALEVYDAPLPLVVEVWSPPTGDYDVDQKLPEYQRRGDLEIWRLHPYERTLRRWLRGPDGRYTETVHRGGVVRPAALPDVTIDLDVLFGA
jgi:Uma2 family endonuclease